MLWPLDREAAMNRPIREGRSRWALPRDDWSAPFAEVWLDRLDLVPGVTILDVASGHGIPPFHLAELVGPTGTVLGMDWSERQVASACVSRRPS